MIQSSPGGSMNPPVKAFHRDVLASKTTHSLLQPFGRLRRAKSSQFIPGESSTLLLLIINFRLSIETWLFRGWCELYIQDRLHFTCGAKKKRVSQTINKNDNCDDIMYCSFKKLNVPYGWEWITKRSLNWCSSIVFMQKMTVGVFLLLREDGNVCSTIATGVQSGPNNILSVP